MSKIKTRETVKDIKALDKAAIASERMKDAFIRSKDTASNLLDDGQVSPSEYANDKVQYVSEDLSREVTHKITSHTKKAAQHGHEAIQRRRAAKSSEKNKYHQSEENYSKQNQQSSSARPSADNQSLKNNFQNTVQSKNASKSSQVQNHDTERITIQGRDFARKQPKVNANRKSQNSSAKVSDKPGQIRHPKEASRAIKKPIHSIKQTGKATAKSAKRTVKTAERTSKVAVKTAQNTARAAQKASVAAQRAAKLAVQSARAAARAAVTELTPCRVKECRTELILKNDMKLIDKNMRALALFPVKGNTVQHGVGYYQQARRFELRAEAMNIEDNDSLVKVYRALVSKPVTCL